MHTIVEFGEDMHLLWIPMMLILVLGCEDFASLPTLKYPMGPTFQDKKQIETASLNIPHDSQRFFLAFDHSTQEICFQGSLAMRYLLNGSTWKRRAKRPFPALDTCCEAPRVPMTVDA